LFFILIKYKREKFNSFLMILHNKCCWRNNDDGGGKKVGKIDGNLLRGFSEFFEAFLGMYQTK
jgi:hypothetical protein